MKMRVLYSTGNKKIKNYAIAIGEAQDEQRAAADTIPPAYSCDNERLVVMVVSAGTKLEDTVRRFTGELTKARAKNTVFVFESKTKTISPTQQQLIDIAKEAGTNVLEDYTHFVEGGSLFSSNLTIDERREIVEWCDKVKENLA
ncbi:MAG: hypothetical protein LUH43_01480 [Clostridia bacterium]|nr:hypothetical protein [Clostridia bacterium]